MPKRKEKPVNADTYHHGSLRTALIDAALEVLAEKGVAGFSLRETARRAGVSPAAPKHHFPDTRALLTELATIAFRDFSERLEAVDVAELSQAEAILALAQTYLTFALERKALFELMWQKGLLDMADAELNSQKQRSFMILDRRVRGSDAPQLERGHEAMAPTLACWSMVHGFSHMAISGVFGFDQKQVAATAQALLQSSMSLLVRQKGFPKA